MGDLNRCGTGFFEQLVRRIMMSADYLDAHNRHWEDAGFLFEELRLANADHLYGMAAECGLKRLMLRFGMCVTTSGSPRNSLDKVHVDGVWGRYATYSTGHLGAGYTLSGANPFTSWHVSQRYDHRSKFNQTDVADHRSGAKQVRDLLQKATLDGII
jgi:hypothetical protein